MFKRILIPLDGSAEAAHAVPVGARIAGAVQGSVILVTVVNHFVLTEQAFTYKNRVRTGDDLSMSEAEAYLEEIAGLPELEHVSVERVILSGPIASTLLSAAATYRTDLIVLSSHTLLGGISEKVVGRATVPVLLLHANGPCPPVAVSGYTRPIRVLVALDGTAFAKAVLNPAAELAAALASPYCGVLHLARVVCPPEIVQRQYVYGPLAVTIEQAQQSLMAVASSLYGGLMAPAVAQSGLAVTWTVIENKRVAEALVRIAERREDASGLGAFGGCDVIAMATHGLTGLQRFTLGSVAAQVMALTRRPVLLMRPVSSAKTVIHSEEAFLPDPVLSQNHAQSQAW